MDKKELSIHNHTRIDNYYWLNERENPKVIDYLNAENEYTKFIMKHTEDLQEKIFATPAVVSNTLYIRTTRHLYAFGN